MAGPLKGLTVLDLTQFLAGPYCTQILGDMGAEIIKIEPFEGDNSRTVPPHFIAGDSAYFVGTNRNKHSVVVDLRKPEGLQLVKDLAGNADVLVENSRPGVMNKLGLEYAALAAANERLIWCSISGFGQDGPYRNRPAYDMIVQALSGGMSLTGERDGHPVRSGIPLGDLSAGMYAAIAILGALEHRHSTGRGDQIDISMLDCQVSMLSYQASYYLASGKVPGRQGRGHDSIPTYRCFTAGDGLDVAITANTERMWRSLCGALDLSELADDPRFATNAERLRNREALDPLLEAAFLRHSSDEWAAKLEAAGIPVATVNSLDRSLSDPQVLHRGMVMPLQGDLPGQRARVVGNPLRFAACEPEPPRYPPPKGRDTWEVLSCRLNIDAGRLKALTQAGIIGTA